MIFLAALLACMAVDGDNVRCNGVNIRLLAIDAPEMPGGCRKGRDCAPGDPHASKAAQASLIEPIRIIPVGRDRWGRPVAMIYAAGINLSCKQLRTGHARYWPEYDRRTGYRIKRECGL